MSRIMATHVSLWDKSGALVALAPGAELPEWAEGQVGEHCLTPATEPTKESSADPEAEDDSPTVKPGAAATPDFTGSAPRRTRPRK